MTSRYVCFEVPDLLLKGAPVLVFQQQGAAGLSDHVVDCQAYNAVSVEVYVGGASPSATIEVQGAPASGGSYLTLPDLQATQTAVTSNTVFDVVAGLPFVKVRLSSVSGTFTVWVTPYVSPGQTQVQATLVVSSLSAITANMGTLTAGSIVIGTTNRIWLNDGDDGGLAIGGAVKADAPFRVTAAGALTATSATITGAITVTSGSIDGVLTIGTSGGIYQGTGSFATPTTGLRVWNDAGIGRIGGYNAGALQWYAGTDGLLYAGGGDVRLEANGIVLAADGASPVNTMRWLEGTTERGLFYFITDGSYGNMYLQAIGSTGSTSLINMQAAAGVSVGIIEMFADGGTPANSYILLDSAGPASYVWVYPTRLHAATALSIGATPASAGALRLSNQAWLAARNATNLADVNMWQVDGSNLIAAGAALAAFTLSGNMTVDAGITIDAVDVGSHAHTGAAGHGVQVAHTSLTTIGTNTHAQIDTHIATAHVNSFNARSGAVVPDTNDYTWAQINKATSSIADITTRSHTSLTDIGTNTHAQVDTHIAATSAHGASSNPGGAAAMLQTDDSGLLQLAGLGIGVAAGSTLLNILGSAGVNAWATIASASGYGAYFELRGNKIGAGTWVTEIDFYNSTYLLGYIVVNRDGADDAGRLSFFTRPAAGTATNRITIYSTGGIHIGSTPADPGANNLRVEGNLRVGNTNYWTLAGWTTNADAAVNGYVTVTIDGTTRKLATIA